MLLRAALAQLEQEPPQLKAWQHGNLVCWVLLAIASGCLEGCQGGLSHFPRFAVARMLGAQNQRLQDPCLHQKQPQYATSVDCFFQGEATALLAVSRSCLDFDMQEAFQAALQAS